MSKYPLQEILEFRLFKEESEKINLVATQNKAHLAEKVLRSAEHTFKEHQKKLQQALAESKDTNSSTPQQIANQITARLSIKKMEQKQQELDQAVHKALTRMEECEEELEFAELAFERAQKHSIRIQNHRKLWLKVERLMLIPLKNTYLDDAE